jgi:hypothetical protein
VKQKNTQIGRTAKNIIEKIEQTNRQKYQTQLNKTITQIDSAEQK